MNKKCPSISYGFTLIELLCVIAIISILTAVALPVINRAKETSKIAACQSNLHQIARVFASYVADNNDTYTWNGDPYLWMGRRWRWPLKKYIALSSNRSIEDPNNPNLSTGPKVTILLCPADSEALQKWDGTSYGYSAAFYHSPEQINSMTTDQLWKSANPSPPPIAQKSGSVLYPSKKALVGEWMTNHSATRTNWWDSTRSGSHNYVFADGHIAFVPKAKILPAVSGLPDVNLTKDGIRGADIK